MSKEIICENYDAINNEIKDMLSTGKYAYVAITVYSDANNTGIATDANGIPVLRKQITNVTTTCCHVNEAGETVKGHITFTFMDGESFRSYDDIDFHWYSLEGVPFQMRSF